MSEDLVYTLVEKVEPTESLAEDLAFVLTLSAASVTTLAALSF